MVPTEFFDAQFPGDVVVEELNTDDDLARTREWTAETEPVGVYAVRVVEIVEDAFIAVGATKWVSIHGDWLKERFASWSPVVVEDASRVFVGGAERRLAIHLRDELFLVARVHAAPARIVVIYAVTSSDAS